MEATVSPERAIEQLPPTLAAALAAAGADHVTAVGRFRSHPAQRGRGGPGLSALELELATVGLQVTPTEEIFIALFDPKLSGSGFSSLHLRLEVGAELLEEAFFDSAGEARDFLAGALLEVGSLPLANPLPPTLPGRSPSAVALLRIGLETNGPRGGLELGFLVATAPLTP